MPFQTGENPVKFKYSNRQNIRMQVAGRYSIRDNMTILVVQ